MDLRPSRMTAPEWRAKLLFKAPSFDVPLAPERIVGITGQSLLVFPLVVELVYGGRRYSLIAFRRSDYKTYSKWRLRLALGVITGRI